MSFTFIEVIIVLSYVLLLLASGLVLLSVQATRQILYEIEMQRFQEVTLDDLQGEANEEDDNVEEETDQVEEQEAKEETDQEEEQEAKEEDDQEEEQEEAKEQEATKEELLQMIDSWKPLADSLKTE
jgi:Skp family chaperone for outer membrane proteins